MTTYQDPPLQSRRAVRQSERPEAQPTSPFTQQQVPRTALGAGEPLSYVTQNRPPLPGYDEAPAAPGRRAAGAVPSEPAAPEAAASEQPSPPQGFRPRDFSPEARTAPPAWAPEHDHGSGVVDYRTQARPQVTPAAASLAASLASEPTEQTLTRRELRALRDAHGITAAPPTDATPVVPAQPAPAQVALAQPAPQQVAPQPAPAPPAPQQVAPQPAPQQFAPLPPVQAAPPAPAPSTQLDSAMAEFDALTGRTSAPTADLPSSRRPGRRAAPQTEVGPEDGLGVVDSGPVAPSAPFVAPAPLVSTVAPEQHAVVLPPAPGPIEHAAFAPYAAPTPEPVAPTTGERPVGHWTNQSDLDDREQINESTISRTIGGGSAAITTSALVLPSIPGHHMETGEVMLTDSVSLPANFAATGAHHSIDESDLDHLLDPGDHQAVNTDSVPIRAIRAVSSHTNSSNPLLASAKPHRGSRALAALIVSASVMVVVVVTLLVVALATDIL